MKTGILKLLLAGFAGYFVTTMALKATASPSPVSSQTVAHHATNWQPVGVQTRRPIGWYNLCETQPGECQAGTQRAVNVELTQEARKLLTTVTVLANHTILGETDDEHYHIDRKTLVDWWTYPDDGAGDCSDYMLLKRKMLIEAGWPRSAALATVVIDQHGEGHAVLTVTTDQGDFILDNLTDKLLRWDKTGYAYVKRQSREDENIWVAIKDGDDPAAIASTSSLPVVRISSR
jgi:predicted transglutaminase-like cysteine proteinase